MSPLPAHHPGHCAKEDLGPGRCGTFSRGRKPGWGQNLGDILALRDEQRPPGYNPLRIPFMQNGRRLEPPEPVTAAGQRCAASLAWLPAGAQALRAPSPVPVVISAALSALQDRLAGELRQHLAS
jgi:nicotinate phosphoribosyltransferase